MKQFPSELILGIFKYLSSLEIAIFREVCSEWFQTMEDNKSLWRRLVLEERRPEWRNAIVELFYQKSNSTPKDVSIGTEPELESEQIDHLKETLQKSRETLQVLSFRAKSPDFSLYDLFPSLIPVLPRLADFRIFHDVSPGDPSVRLLKGKTQMDEFTDSANKLFILWIRDYERVPEAALGRLNHLTSLTVWSDFGDWSLTQSDWEKGLREFLVQSPRTLKHLCLCFSKVSADPTEFQALNFPSLKVLELKADGLPLWMTSISDVTLILLFVFSDHQIPPEISE